jgi:hypothetical protein
VNSVLSSNALANCALVGGAVTDGGHNIATDASCPAAFGDPKLGPLADNGGRTRTMALGEGSAAIDFVPASGSGCPAADQRGTARPQRTACDAGAYELLPKPPEQTGGGGTTEEPAPTDTTPPTTTAPPTATTTLPADKTRPVVRLRLRAQRLLKLLKNGYAADFSSTEPGSAVVELFAEGTDVKGAAVRRKRVARATRTFTTAGTKRVTAKFTKRAKKAFAKRKRLRLLLVVTVKDAAGNVTKVSRRVSFKR